jgi:hypothetical protein
MDQDNYNGTNNLPENSNITSTSTPESETLPVQNLQTQDQIPTPNITPAIPINQIPFSEKPKLKLPILLPIVLILIALGVGAYFWFTKGDNTAEVTDQKNNTISTQEKTGENNEKVISSTRENVKDGKGTVIFSMIRPSGWILDQYFPRKTGVNPVVLFSSLEDKEKVEKVMLDRNNQDNYLKDTQARMLSVGALTVKSSEQFLALGAIMSKDKDFDTSYSLDSNSTSTGKCWQVKKQDVYHAECYIIQSGKYLLYTMHTFGSNYENDKTGLEKFINSIEF